jgi:tRNA threonylcarbamoyladenosine biosynthesis protein TsaE
MSAPAAVRSGAPEQTRAIAERLGALLRAGDVLLLSGELGAGKTTFVQGLARGLGFEGAVSSKSFVLLGEYQGRVKLYHADLYRLDGPEQVQDLALDEISMDGVLVVEWPERARRVLPREHLWIEFKVAGETERELCFEARGARAEELAGALAEVRS